MTILVTAASGHLGRLVVESLLARGADPADLVATARDTSKLEDLAARGIPTAVVDYDRPDTIAAALDGVDAVLLISGSIPGVRVQGHRNVIDAAKAAGVAKLVYTSAPKATTAEDFPLAADHRATEEAIAAAVRTLIGRRIDRPLIRQRTIEKLSADRRRLIAVIAAIHEQEGVTFPRDADWMQLFRRGTWPFKTEAMLFAETAVAETRPA